MTDLRLSEPNGYTVFHFDSPSFVGLLKTVVTPAVDERFTNMQETVTLSQGASIMLYYLDGGYTFEDLKFIRARSQSIRIPVLQTSLQLEKRLGE
jgi:hypothetical protein